MLNIQEIIPRIKDGSLKELNLDKCDLEGKEICSFEGLDIINIAEALKDQNCKVTKIVLRDHHLSYSDKMCIFYALQKNTTVTEIDLSNTNMSEEEVRSLGERVIEHPSCNVTTIHLGGNQMGDEGAFHISESLQNPNCKLTTLTLSNCNIKFEGAEYIAAALKHNNCKVTDLNVGRNDLTDLGVQKIADALKDQNCKVTMFVLGGVYTKDGAAKAIADVMKHPNNKLITARLPFSDITDIGAKALASALKHQNCKVTMLDMFGSDRIGDKGKQALTEAGWDERTDKITRASVVGGGKNNNFIHNAIDFASKHKGKLVLAGVAACAIVACYKKPELLTNLKDIFFGMFEKASSFVMGK